MTDKPRKLRSAQWFGTADKNGFMYRSWMKNQGIPDLGSFATSNELPKRFARRLLSIALGGRVNLARQLLNSHTISMPHPRID